MFSGGVGSWAAAFQFLIGTLKTEKVAADMLLRGLFQFLIGTLKTERREQELRDYLWFQFLIGTLKTHIKPIPSFHPR